MQTPNQSWRERQRKAGLTQKLIWVLPDEWAAIKAFLDKLRKLREVKP